MSEAVGLFDKYEVIKKDGTTDPYADYFVLRLDKDPHAIVAAKAYAESIKSENINLSMDIYGKVMKYEQQIQQSDKGITEYNAGK